MEDKPGDSLTESELTKMAYVQAMRLRASGLDDEAIYARLEKHGIPAHIAAKVALDVFYEKEKVKANAVETSHNAALIKIGVGVVGGLISYILLPEHYVLPVGMVLGGIVSAIWTKLRMN